MIGKTYCFFPAPEFLAEQGTLLLALIAIVKLTLIGELRWVESTQLMSLLFDMR